MSQQWKKLCSESLLLAAWKAVRSKGSTGGIDGVTVIEFEKNIQRRLLSIADDIRSGTWKPLPYKQIEVPKGKGSDEVRPLGMASVRDKVVMQAIKMVIEDRCERLFLGNSYAYRPQKGAVKAIRRLLFEAKNKKWTYILRLDIDNFFDNIDHQILLRRLTSIGVDSEIIRLIMLSVRMGKVSQETGEWIEQSKGVPQGAVLSPLLSNLYLTSFDQFAVSNMKPYIRYADDFIFLCEDRTSAEELLARTTSYLNEKLGLQLNEPLIKPLNEGFEFLGVCILNDIVSVSEQKKMELEARIRSLELCEEGWSPQSSKIWKGMCNYYAKLLPQPALEEMDAILIGHISDVLNAQPHAFHSKARLRFVLGTIQFLSRKVENERKIWIDELIAIFVNRQHAEQQESDEDKNDRIIAERKKEFRKLEAEANTLLVSSPGVFVGLTNRGITVKQKGMVISTCREDNLSHIIITGKGVSLSSNLLEYCLSKKIPVDFFDAKGKHIGSVLNARYIESSRWRLQAELDDSRKNMIALSIVEGKIKNQFNLIKYFHKYHKKHYPALVEKMEMMKTTVVKFKLFKDEGDIDSSNFMTILVGHEAQVAIRYWDYIRELVSDDQVGFHNREHHGAKDLMNSMLNYGYAILYVRAWQALLGAKLNPFDSFIHVRSEGKPTLVYDFVELFRSQVVDRVVISLIQKGHELGLTEGLLNDDTRKLLAKSVMERLARYEKYKGVEMKMEKIIEIQAQQLAKSIENGDKFKPYLAKW